MVNKTNHFDQPSVFVAGIKNASFWDLHKQLGQCYQAKGDSLKKVLQRWTDEHGIFQWNGDVLESFLTFKRCFRFKRDF